MLRFSDLACRRDGQVLFSDVSEFFARQHKVGLTGRNGCGKSSLFSMILGNLDADEGRLEIQPGTLLAHVAQETPASASTAIDYVIDGDTHLRSLQQALGEHGVALGGGSAAATPQSDASAPQLARLLEEYDVAGGYTAEARAGMLLNGLGFSAQQHHLPVNDFSGGWRMRLNLAQALMCPSDLLLLDEPTNHLDLDAVFWLQSWLRRYEGTLLLISHDREFLDAVVDSVLHVEHQTITRYSGNYSAFERIRAERLALGEAMYQRQQKKIAHVQRFIDRFRAQATKARQAQSRIKMLERMQVVSQAQVDSGFSFQFDTPKKMSDPLVTLEGASIGYNDQAVLNGVNFRLGAGDRVALLGRNGAGKSTLVKALVGELELLSGKRTAGANLSCGYFAQHQIDQLDYSGTALDQLQNLDPSLSEAQCRNILGGFGFSGEMALQSVSVLSGGEKARLVLALLVHSRPNLLLLDEPTNHLDMDMRFALSEAMQSFSGALVVVSHDRFLLESVADELWLVADQHLTQYDDDLNGYRRWLSKQVGVESDSKAAQVDAAVQQDNKTAGDRKEDKRLAAQKRQQLAPLRNKVQKAEKACESLQKDLSALHDKLADNDLYSGERQTELNELLQQQKQLQTELESAEAQWMELCEELEQAQAGD